METGEVPTIEGQTSGRRESSTAVPLSQQSARREQLGQGEQRPRSPGSSVYEQRPRPST
jgi:hypothetical protein